MRGPGLFSDIGRKAKDLLKKDYIYDERFTTSTPSFGGMVLTAVVVRKGGFYAQYDKENDDLITFNVDADLYIKATYTVLEALPYMKAIATYKGSDCNNSGPRKGTKKLEVQYFHDHAALSSVVALKQTQVDDLSLKQIPVVDLSASFGAHGIVFGAEAGFDTSSGAFTKYNAGVGLKKQAHDLSVILSDKGDRLRASYVYHLDEKQKSSVLVEINRRLSTNENVFTVGGAYTLNPQTIVKARMNNSGKLGALLQHEVRHISYSVTLSGEFETKALVRKPKFGLAIALLP